MEEKSDHLELNRNQKAIDMLERLYSLHKGIKNDYPFLEYKKEEKLKKEKGIVSLINKDKEGIRFLIDSQLSVEEIDTIINKIKYGSNHWSTRLVRILKKLEKQREILNNDNIYK